MPLMSDAIRLPSYGQRVFGRAADGREVRAAVFDERQARAAAGITMVVGAVAFAYAYFDKRYAPLQAVTAFFLVEFLVRVTLGLRWSPVGVVARAVTSRGRPEWVSARPKRFAWTLGLVMAAAMTFITNSGIRGALPRTICLLCLTLMWLESVLGFCVGCEIAGVLVRCGWRRDDPDYALCAASGCELHPVEPC